MQKCRYLGAQLHAIKNGDSSNSFSIHRCEKLGAKCTEIPRGLSQSGLPMLTCEGCSLFKARPELVSAVCLAYDLPRRQNILEEAVESFLRQTYPLKELVIVVDTPGLEIECNAPGVRIINVPPCATLGDKYNAGVSAARGSLICSWDDDDISLPWRMALSVELIGQADYYNPKAYWIENGGDLQHEVRTGYAHNASMFRKSAWADVGGYQSLPDNSQDAKMDDALLARLHVLGSGRIERSSYLYRWSTGLHHGSYGKNRDAGGAGNFRLKPHWRKNYAKLAVDARPVGIPCWLTNRDTMAIREMVYQLLTCDEVGQITIVDCDSTYQPLLDWYENECPVNVIRAPNLGHFAPWKYLDQSDGPYFSSDGDFDLTGVPRDFLTRLKETLEKFPNIVKAGLSLSIDDLPDDSPVKAKVIAHESKFWENQIDSAHYDAAIDTTLALYRAGTGWGGYSPAIRLAPPYVARHVPWYLTPETTGPDWRHYFSRLDPKGITWGPALADQLPKPSVSRTSTGKKLTIGMATYRDWPGVWATIQSLRIHHSECLSEVEIIVVDNDPDGDPFADGEAAERSHSTKCRRLCERIGAKYDHYTAISGTAAAKGRIFDLATSPAVLVMDCHVILPPGTVRRIIDWFSARHDSKDLYQGPLIGDGGLGDIVGTHFSPTWGTSMYGQWGIDNRVNDGRPFEIDMQGCGLFACNKKAWPGFHPLLRGFGPEEFHIHQRIRRNGGKCWCLPWLLWCHRFGNPNGAKPPGMSPEERVRGHLITHLDTGLPDLAGIEKHFVDDMKSLTKDQFFKVLRDTVAEFFASRSDVGADCQYRDRFLKTVECEVGCQSTRKPLPIFGCKRHGECAPWRWQQGATMQTCLTCLDRSGDEPPR